MKTKYLYKDVEAYVDTEVEIEIDFEDVLELIESCNEEELKIIRSTIKLETESAIPINNLYDEQKFQLLLAAMKKYNLEQLQDKLGIKNDEY